MLLFMCLCFRNVSYKQNIGRFYLLAIQFFNLLTGKFGSFTFIVIPDFIIILCGAFYFPMIFSPLFFLLCFKSILLPFFRGEHRQKRREPLPLSKLKSKQGQKPECHADGLHSPQQNLHVTHFLAAQHPQKAPKNKSDDCVIKFRLTSQP